MRAAACGRSATTCAAGNWQHQHWHVAPARGRVATARRAPLPRAAPPRAERPSADEQVCCLVLAPASQVNLFAGLLTNLMRTQLPGSPPALPPMPRAFSQAPPARSPSPTEQLVDLANPSSCQELFLGNLPSLLAAGTDLITLK